MNTALPPQKPFSVVYLAMFLFSMHFALPNYINSSFLNQFFPESALGMIYVGGSLLTLLALSQYPKILTRFGNYRATLFLIFFEIVLLLALSLTPHPFIIMALFMTIQTLISLGLFNLDVFLETYTKVGATGTVRSIMLTAMNTAILIGPLLAGIILADGDYWKIYLLAAALLIPILFLLAFRFRSFKDPQYDHTPIHLRIHQVLFTGHPNDHIRHVLIANLIMRFFYSWMVIYTPIYLHQHIGFSWTEIGIILPVMLLPFVLFEYPLGKLMDKKSNERGVMIAGFGISAVFTAMLSLFTLPVLALWALLLFCTRIGMSFVEIGSESYFFRQINAQDTNILSIFRDARPIAWIAGPLSASALLFVIDIQYLYVALAFVLLFGMWNSFRLK